MMFKSSFNAHNSLVNPLSIFHKINLVPIPFARHIRCQNPDKLVWRNSSSKLVKIPYICFTFYHVCRSTKIASETVKMSISVAILRWSNSTIFFYCGLSPLRCGLLDVCYDDGVR